MWVVEDWSASKTFAAKQKEKPTWWTPRFTMELCTDRIDNAYANANPPAQPRTPHPSLMHPPTPPFFCNAALLFYHMIIVRTMCT